MQRLDGLRHLTVKELSTKRQESRVDHLAYPIVHERQLLTDGAQHLPPHQLFDSGRCLVLPEP